MIKHYHSTGHDLQRTAFRYAQKACKKGFCGLKLLFLKKIKNFSQKQQLRSDRFSFMPVGTRYYLIVLISLSFSMIYAQDMGVRLTSGTLPNATLDVNGSVSFREGTALALVNGVNSDIALTAYSFFRITGPTAAFSLTGCAGGVDGRMLTLINASGQTLTLTHQATSTSANQINTGGSDMSIIAGGIATLFYNSSLSKWVVTSATNTPPKFSGIGEGSLTDSMLVVNNGIAGRVKPVDFIETYAWGLDGNAGTTAGTNFMGTTDAKDVVFKANGTEGMRLANTTRYLGVGATTPAYKIHVEETGGFDADIAARLYNTNNLTYQPALLLQTSGGTKAAATAVANTTALGVIRWGGYDGSAFNDIQCAEIGALTTQTWSTTAHGTSLLFKTVPNSTTTAQSRMIIDQNGNIGIGLTTPSVKLQIDGGNATATYTKFTAGTTTNQTSSDGFDVGVDASGNAVLNQKEALPMILSTNNTEVIRVSSAGDVLIGALTPAETTGLALVNQSASDQKDDATITTYNSTTTPAFVIFKARGTAVAPTILTNNETIGGFNANGYTGSAFASLTAVSTVTASDYTTSFGGDIAFKTSRSGTSSERMRIMSTGNVGIGVAAPSHILQISGQGRATNSAWATTSDVRLKDIDSPYEYGLKELLKVKTYRFHYKKDNPLNLPTDKAFQGVIAQELQKVMPEAVAKMPDGYLTVSTDPVFWATVNAVKELDTQNKQLKAEVEQLKAELAKQGKITESITTRLERLETALASKETKSTTNGQK